MNLYHDGLAKSGTLTLGEVGSRPHVSRERVYPKLSQEITQFDQGPTFEAANVIYVDFHHAAIPA